MKLYYAPNTSSLAAMILAEWLELPLDIERVDHRNPGREYLEVNPLGAVPALELDDGRHMAQLDAILQYFCDLKPESGLDAGDDIIERFELRRWIAFLTGDYHPAFGVWFDPRRFTADHSEASVQAVKTAAAQRIARLSHILDEQVGEDGHVALARRTLLDAYAYSTVRWLDLLESRMTPYSRLEKFIRELSHDAGVRRALEREDA